MKTLPLLLVSALLSMTVSAQNTLTGTVTDAKGEPLPAASVLLLAEADSALVKGQISNGDGTFTLSNVGAGNYILAVSMLGYIDNFSEVFRLNAESSRKDLGNIVLTENTTALGEVQIVAKRPLYEQKIDRLVVNVENSITAAGGTALDVLERTPGVIVNRQSNAISLAGKNGVQIMVNGRMRYVPAEGVVQMLKSMGADNIESIEIITTPPANFDAEGNAGYINIVLKKNPDDGLNGSYALSAGYGRGGVGSANVNLNYRKGKLNLFSDYSYLYEAQEQTFEVERSVQRNGDLINTKTVSNRNPTQNNHNARLGIDYQIGKKTVIGALLSGYNTKWEMISNNRSGITLNSMPDTLIRILNNELNQWENAGVNLNLLHTFQPGETFSMDVDYLYYFDNNPNDYLNTYFDGSDNFLYDQEVRSTKETPIQFLVGKADYTRKWGDRVNMEAGIKGVRSSFTNDVGVETRNGPTWTQDQQLTGKYDLNEYIAAAYTAFDLKINDKTSMKAGLRYEYTDSNLGSEEQADIVDRQYGYLFPSIFLSHNLTERQSLNLAYSRRISRPTFGQMAPFVIFFDPSTFISGNAAIQPAIADNIALSYRINSVFLSVQYTFEDSTIALFQTRIDPVTNRQIIASENLKNTKTATVNLNFPVKFSPWWELQANLTANWQQANAYFDEAPLQVEQIYYTAFMNNRFTISKNIDAELGGYYQSSGLWGTFTNLPVYGMQGGIQRKLGADGGTLRLGIDDIFNSYRWGGESNLEDQDIRIVTLLDFSQRTFRLTYSRNFGDKGVKAARERKAAEEEKRRVN